jgi:hypothetical protein
MTLGNGIEFRIFDNFSSTGLYSLCKIIAYIAENSRLYESTEYVYEDKDWIESLHRIMEQGWLAIITDGYLKKLRKQLNLKIQTTSLRADVVIQTIADELHSVHKNGLWTKLMLDDDKAIGSLPLTNRYSWELGFAIKANREDSVLNSYNKLLTKLCEKYFDKGVKKIKLNIMKKIIVQSFGKLWEPDWLNIVYFMNTEGVLIPPPPPPMHFACWRTSRQTDNVASIPVASNDEVKITDTICNLIDPSEGFTALIVRLLNIDREAILSQK